MYSDIQITCKNCNNPFILTAGEQEFFATRTTNDGQPLTPPKRCKSCRAQARAQREGGATQSSGPAASSPSNQGGGQFHPGGGYSSGNGDKGRGKRNPGGERGRRNDRGFSYDE